MSSVQGAEKTSHITQRSKGESYAESQGWTVVGAFEDLDVSAIKMTPWERPDLREWLADRPEDWDALIFAKTDRVFRSAADCVRLAEWCRENRKILVLVDDGIKLDYYNPEDSKDAFAGAMSKVFLILASVFAEIEGQRFVQRARDRVSYLRPTDRWGYGAPPYGYRIVDHESGRGKALDSDAEAQTVLRGVVARFLAGDSLTSITAGLNRGGVPAPRDHARARNGREVRGERWTRTRLRGILSNPATQGVKTAGGRPVLNGEGEPVRVGPESFTPEVWQQLQDELAKRAQSPRERRHSTNPLLGVAKCAVCHKNMRQHSKTKSTGVTYRYYVCAYACPGVSVVAEDAERLVESVFLRTHSGRRVRERRWQSGSDHSADLERATRTIEALREDRALGLYSSPEDQELYRQQMAALIARRDALAELPSQRAGWTEVEAEKTYGEAWPGATPDERREMLRGRIRLVVRRPNEMHLVESLDDILGEGPSAAEVYSAWPSPVT